MTRLLDIEQVVAVTVSAATFAAGKELATASATDRELDVVLAADNGFADVSSTAERPIEHCPVV